MDERETIHQGWLEFCSESTGSKSWMKLSKKSSWKRKYFVLYYLSEDTDKIYLVTYDKDENWHCTDPKKRLELFPRYKIAKLQNYKGKENVLEVNNENEQWYLSSDKPKLIDLWATQIQMQTKLSRAISGRIFSVSGAVSKQMQKIGAAQQRCLLHFTRWGVTLALQDSRAILAMWPMKTIRNYESSQCKFSIEAGRKSPMGEGLFVFHTNIGQDEEMFNVMDAFIAAGLNEKAELNPNKKVPNTDDEILQIYDALHRAALGINHETPPLNAHLEAIDTPGYAPLGREMASSISRDSISIYKPPDYNRLFTDRGAISPPDSEYNKLFDERGKSIKDFSPGSDYHGCETPRGLSFSDNMNSYDQLDRKPSWGSKSITTEYDHINQTESQQDGAQSVYDKIGSLQDSAQSVYDKIGSKHDSASSVYDKIGSKQDSASSVYDKINLQQHQNELTVSLPPETGSSKRSDHAFVGFPLRDEPSVPYLDADSEKPFMGRSPLSKTPDDQKYEFRNSIYTPIEEEKRRNDEKERTQIPLSQTPEKNKYEFRNSIYAPAEEEMYVNDSSIVALSLEKSDIPLDTPALPLRNDSSVSCSVKIPPTKQRTTSSSFKDKSMQDIADHFLYQMPSSFSTKENISTFPELTREEENPPDDDTESEMYQNAESARMSVFDDITQQTSNQSS